MNLEPFRTIEWRDHHTSAVGWIVVDRLVNGVCGGGLFMHPGATLAEVADLAATMSLKNTLVRPGFGGGKGGIRFDAASPDAEGVLRRFMLANRAVIADQWSTGADLYTSNEIIEKIAREDLNLPSAFAAIGDMIGRLRGIPSQAERIGRRMTTPWNDHFTLDECATGYSVAQATRVVATTARPRLAIQGFGHVGSSAAYFLQTLGIADVVGICEKDGFIVNHAGLNIERLVCRSKQPVQRHCETGLGRLFADGSSADSWRPRKHLQSDESMLVEFIREARPTVLSPCAMRYVITETVLNHLIESRVRFIISGANNVFASPQLEETAERAGITILPEWVSNSGNAILFTELLSKNRWSTSTAGGIFTTIKSRIANFVDDARRTELSLRAGCQAVARKTLENASQKEQSDARKRDVKTSQAGEARHRDMATTA